ncbi:MAG: proton-conducting transporter membrane subunit [Candidatus Margulisiibacteriota bacterium]
MLLSLIFAPLFGAILAYFLPNKYKGPIAFLIALHNLVVAIYLFNIKLDFSLPWAGFGINFALRYYNFSAFIVSAISFFATAITLYSIVFMEKKNHQSQFWAYLLITVAMATGAALANNLVLLLFFWEGLLLTLFGMISIGNPAAYKTATKAFIIVGFTDICLMLGIGMTGLLANTLTMSQINLPINSLSSIAFILLMIGAIGKAGSMPFHSWIPEAALDAPLPFMSLFPAALEKLLGIYLLARITLDFFQLQANSWLSLLLMIVGATTIILAVMMALIQKDYKKLLSYHAISQVGYMVLGIGTCLPAGIVGGIFHMINHALYKSCLFLTGGSVEKQTGTTDLNQLGGLGWKMPVTFGCFIVAAASISGVPPFNGFFSKELVYDAALERGSIFYIVAVLGSFFTAASFLKLGHAAYLGKTQDKSSQAKEAPLSMLIPMLAIAAACILFGLFNWFPINHLVSPILGAARLEGHSFAGMPTNMMLIVVTLLVLLGAIINHIFGVRSFGSGLKAADHIHYAPGLKTTYALAEKKIFDPYEIGMVFVRLFSRICWLFDRLIDWFYDTFCAVGAFLCGKAISKMHSGNYATYILWSLLGSILALAYLVR